MNKLKKQQIYLLAFYVCYTYLKMQAILKNKNILVFNCKIN